MVERNGEMKREEAMGEKVTPSPSRREWAG